MNTRSYNWFQKIFFMQAGPAIRKAHSGPLGPEDMPPLHEGAYPAQLTPELLSFPVPTADALIWGLAKNLKSELARAFALSLLYALAVLAGPLMIYSLVMYVGQAASGAAPFEKGLWAGLGLCLAGALTGLFQHHYFHQSLRIMQRITAAMNMRVFGQGLRLTRQARMNRPMGDIVNLIGSDSDYVAFSLFEGTEFITRIFMLIGASAMLIGLLGWAGLIGLATLILFVPLARRVGKSYMRLDDEIMGYRDRRVSLMSQILSGIRIVKYFAWERQMQGEIESIRAQEIGARRRLFRSLSGSLFIYFGGSLTVGLVAFLSALALGRQLDAATIFAALALFGLLDGTIGSLSEIVSVLATARVSAGRIASFLNEPTLAEAPLVSGIRDFALSLRDVGFQYEDAAEPALHAINLKVEAGEALAVVGAVGSGKTSLLLGLMREIPQVAGSIAWDGLAPGEKPAIAYVPQEALIMNGTLRENILLGADAFSADALRQAIWSAALDKDVQALAGGLSAEIGEQGINLSGGQRQRVNLARAAMINPNLLLLDDPLSAVDFHTEDELMERLLFGLWKDKTRIFVTHRLHHLDRFDRVVFMQKGRVSGIGSLSELENGNAAFRLFLQRSDRSGLDALSDEAKDAKPAAAETRGAEESFRITDEEERSLGGVQLSVYKSYAKAWLGERRGLSFSQLGIVSLMAIGLPVLQQSWLAYWSNHLLSVSAFRFGIWGLLGFLSVLAAGMHQRLWLHKALAAGESLHKQALGALLKAPLSYFDRTPIGRVLNRFSRDMDSVEREIAPNLERTIGPVLHTLAAIFIIAVNIPLLIFAVAPALGGYYLLQKRYRHASRDAQRLTSIARSPRFAFFKEALSAAPLIRAHGQEQAFIERYEGLLTEYQRMNYASILFNRWFSSRIPLLGAVITFALITAILLLSRHGGIAAGTAGLTLVYVLRLCDYLNNAIRSFTVVESNLIGVERLQQLSALDAEIAPSMEGRLSPDTQWPTAGAIVFEDVAVRYAPHLPEVLRGIDLSIKAKEKIGVIGRTGAGKSTLFQSLFRFVVPTRGRILIDGVDTRLIPLDRLRRSLAIIPQDPVLFQGTLRSNLDCFNQFDDARIELALKRSHLEAWVKSLAGGLETEIKESGYNFSQGQRQLLCLARALLLDTKIIVMDEATASVDVATDALIQQTLREECKDKTVLIIAHRLETLGLCDRVVEMREGQALPIR